MYSACPSQPLHKLTSHPHSGTHSLEHSTAIAIRGSLLAVGGSRGSEHSSAIHVYQQEKNTWAKVGHLPTEREDCACCLLPSSEMLVAGGLDKDGHGTSQVNVATVLDWLSSHSHNFFWCFALWFRYVFTIKKIGNTFLAQWLLIEQTCTCKLAARIGTKRKLITW